MAYSTDDLARTMRAVARHGLKLEGVHTVSIGASLFWRGDRDVLRVQIRDMVVWLERHNLKGYYEYEWPEYPINRPLRFYFTDETTAFHFKLRWA